MNKTKNIPLVSSDPFTVGSVRQYAVGKANAPGNAGEGGPAVIRFAIPRSIYNKAVTEGGEVRFEPGHGLEELQGAWKTSVWLYPPKSLWVMANTRNDNVAEELQAFEAGIKSPNEEAFVEAVNHLLVAAFYAQTFELSVHDDAKVWARVGGQDYRPIELPHGVGTFRTILARVGTICRAASLKVALLGKARALLIRVGVIADKYMTEQKSRYLEYVRATIRDQPGSPLYVLDADLHVKIRGGDAARMAIKMSNQSQDFKLVINRL
jgi:hypothetical protein